jgi:hypothetical protein
MKQIIIDEEEPENKKFKITLVFRIILIALILLTILNKVYLFNLSTDFKNFKEIITEEITKMEYYNDILKMNTLEELEKEKFELSLSQGVIAHWSLDKNSTKDSVGINDAINHGAAYIEDEEGGAFYFDGVEDYIELPKNSPDFNLDKGAISFWIFPEMSKAEQDFAGLVYYRKASTSDFFIIRIYEGSIGNSLRIYAETNNTSTLSLATSDEPIIKQEWNHILIQQNGEYIDIIVNGKQQKLNGVNSGDWFGDHFIANKDFNIGDSGSWSSNNVFARFRGAMKEVKIWERVLSEEEIFFLSHLD